MAQATSALWKALWCAPGTAREYQFDIAGKIYGPDVEVTHSVDSGLYEQFGIGNAATAKLTLSLFAESVPKGAVIKRYIRLRNGERVSEWLPKGVFFINRRGEEDGYWTIEAFDAMRRAEQSWEPDQSLEFPLPMPEAVAEFARIMEVEIDPRTRLNPAYAIDYPASAGITTASGSIFSGSPPLTPETGSSPGRGNCCWFRCCPSRRRQTTSSPSTATPSRWGV